MGGGRYMVPASIIGRNFRLFTNFVIDTGSPWSILMEHDLKAKTRIPYASYPKVNRVNLIIPIDLMKLGKCKIVFRDRDGQPVEFDQELYGGMLVNRQIELIQTIPSFLGKDFLDEHNLFVGKRGDDGVRYMED